MTTKKGLIYVVDMESGLADALSRRIIDMNQWQVFRAWDANVNVEAESEAYSDILAGIILSGSSKNVNSQKYNPPRVPEKLFQLGVPILGICYGMQFMAKLSGVNIARCWDEVDPAKRTKGVKKKDQGEQGPTLLNLTPEGQNSILFRGCGTSFPIWMKHRYMAESLPDGWTHTSNTERCPIASMEMGNYYCVQFHPEPYNSLFGRIILHNFLTRACGVDTPWF